MWIAGYRFAFVCVLTALAVTCPPSLRGRTMGILGAMSSLATVVGAPFVGSIAEALGWRNGILGFAGAAVTGAIIVGIFYSGRSSGSSANTSRAAQIHAETSGSAFRTPRVWALALLLGLVGLPSFSVTFFVPSAAESAFGIEYRFVIVDYQQRLFGRNFCKSRGWISHGPFQQVARDGRSDDNHGCRQSRYDGS